MKNFLNNKKGFTLIELAIATALMAIVLGGMALALQQQQRQFRLTSETADIEQTARALLDIVATELRNAGSRQGKNISVQLINGGSIAEEDDRCLFNAPDSLTGTINSPPDCISITSWDIARGLESDPTEPEDDELNKKPSLVEQPEPPQLVGGQIVLDLPESWFDEGEFIGGTINDEGRALIGFRSSATLCHPNEEINCLERPERCTQCAMVFEVDIDVGTEQGVITSVDDIVDENLPVTFTTVEQIMNGVDIDPADSDPTLYGLLDSITLSPAELSIVKTKAFRLDPITRSLEMSEDGMEFESIAGGEEGDTGKLEASGIVDLQFVVHLQDPDGRISRVGMCIDGNCNDSDERVFDDFAENISIVDGYYGAGGDPTDDLRCCAGREQDIRAIEIFIVVKSKERARQLQGKYVSQNIRPIADVAQRRSPVTEGQSVTDPGDVSIFGEPEEGFVYRVFTTTVYLRNISTENYG